MSKTIDQLTPEGRQFYAELEKLKKLQVRIGYQSDGEVYEDGTTILEAAVYNELGTANIPERPFLRKSVDDNPSEITDMCNAQVAALTQGASAKEVLQQLGVFQKGLVQEKIVDGDFTENAPSTIKKKGSDTPLVDRSVMREGTNYWIVEKGRDR